MTSIPTRVSVLGMALLLLASGPEAAPEELRDPSAAPAAPETTAPGRIGPQWPEAFGFQLGEERRYVLGPPGSLPGVEWAEWRIVLDRIQGAGEEWRAVFELGYENATKDLVVVERLSHWHAEGHVHVNRFGFPEHIEFTPQILGSGPVPAGVPRAVYRREGDLYRKTARFPSREHEFEVHIAGSGSLDLSEPSGIFLFVPDDRGDNLFSNPGLLSLALRYPMPDTSWDERVFFLTPTETPHWESPDWLRQERDRRETVSKHFRRSRIGLDEMTEVEIGTRTMRAWRLDLALGELRSVYVDGDGRVLRADLDYRAPLRKQLWIRLRLPSE